MKQTITVRNPLAMLRDMAVQWIVSKGAFAREIVLTSPFSSNLGQSWDFENFHAAYRVHPSVYTCVRAISDNFAQVPWVVYRKRVVDGKVRRIPVPDHPLQKVLNRPNPFCSSFDLRKNSMGYHELDGNVYWLLAKNGPLGPVQQIINLRPDRVTIVPSRTEYIEGYTYRIGDYVAKLFPDEIIHFKQFNPWDDLYGQSTIEAARNTVTTDLHQRKYNTQFFKNSAIPKGGLGFDQKLEDDDYKTIHAEWEKAHGGPEKHHKIAILEKGARWLNIGITQKDMEYLAGLKFNQDEIGKVFGVPPVLQGSYQRATFNNANAQIRTFWHETEMPKIMSFEQTIDLNLNKLMGVRAAVERDFGIAIDPTNVHALKQERAEARKMDIESVKSGVETVNEVRERNNLEPVEWGETWFRNRGLVPWDQDEPSGGLSAPRKISPTVAPSPVAGSSRIVLLSDADERRRLAQWKGFLIVADHYEPRFRKVCNGLFVDQRKIVLARLDAYSRLHVASPEQKKPIKTETDVEAVLFDLEKAKLISEEMSEDLYAEMMNSSGNRAFRIAEVAGSFDLDMPRAQRVMRSKMQKFAVEINETTWGRLKTSLIKGMEDGDSINQMAVRVRDVMKTRIRSDEWLIARTEVIGTTNGGLFEGFSQTGIIKSKSWLDAADEATRDAHRQAGRKKRIKMNDHFVLENKDGTKAYLLYPGDPDGGAEQVCNCRCTVEGHKTEAPE